MKTRGARRPLLLGLAIAVTAGCVHNGFTPATAMQFRERPEGCYLDMIFQGVPPYPYVIIGRVSTDSTAPGLFALGENNEVAMQRLQEEACRVGAHGLMHAGAQSQGSWTGNGYSKSTTGEAVAFVYVDAYGRPMPPPTAARPMIHPGAYPLPPPPVPPGGPGSVPSNGAPDVPPPPAL